MATAIVGIVLQTAGGVDYPTVPPGPIILAAAAGAHLGYELQNEPLLAELAVKGRSHS